MKKRITAVLASTGLIILALFLSRGGNTLGPLVTIQNIKRIHIGMDSSQVTNILGEPSAIELGYLPNTRTMTYSSPHLFRRWYPMLWVHLTNNVVREVYAKQYYGWGLDDMGVYGISKDNSFELTNAFYETFPDK